MFLVIVSYPKHSLFGIETDGVLKKSETSKLVFLHSFAHKMSSWSAAPAMASAVAEPAVAIVGGEDFGYATCLVCFGAIIFIGFIALNLLPWRQESVLCEYQCDAKNNPCKAGRGSDGHELFGILAGSKNPHSGMDNKKIHVHGHGLAAKDKRTISAIVSNASSFL